MEVRARRADDRDINGLASMAITPDEHCIWDALPRPLPLLPLHRALPILLHSLLRISIPLLPLELVPPLLLRLLLALPFRTRKVLSALPPVHAD
jgi:hypothetical protein